MDFRRLDIIIAEPGFPPHRNARVIVCWELVTQHSGIDEITFDVERSLSPQFTDNEGETVVVAEKIPGIAGQLIYEYIDITPNLISFWRNYFYRIKANTPKGPVYSAIRHWETNPRPHELAIIERHDFVLRYIQGQPSFLFVERTEESARCSCFDVTTGRVLDSKCTLCLGTGRQRPYFSPILHYVDFNPDQKMVDVHFREEEPGTTDCWFSAFPIAKPGDIVYELLKGRLWRIGRVGTVQPQGTTIQHIARLHVLEKTEVEYQNLPQQISDKTLKETVQEWERIKEERMF